MASNPTGSPLRSLLTGSGSLISGLFPTAATYFAPRISRGLVLKLSLLLFARSILASIPLPVNAYLLNNLFSFIFNFALSSIGVSAFAGYFDWGGPFASLGRRLFKPTDSPFITLYASFVCLVGPLLSLIEAAVIVFSAMKFSRNLELRVVHAKNESEQTMWRNIMLAISAALYLLNLFAVYTLYNMAGGNPLLPVALCTFTALFFIVAYIHDQGNILDAALLTMYTAFLALCAIIEERDVRNNTLLKLLSNDVSPSTPESRAALLTFTVVLSLIAVSQLLPLVQVITFGHDAVSQQAPAQQHATQPPATAHGVPALGLQAAGLTAPVPIQAVTEPPVYRDGLLMALAVAGVTFRTLVWTRELRAGEYLPAATRAVQTVATLVVFVCFLKIEGDDADEQERRQKEQATGKVD